MNLLTDPLIRVETSDGILHMCLPELLAALGENRAASLPGLQRHQEDAFHIFLCYLAGALLAREGRESPLQTADFWREGIRRLTGRNDDCAWTLVVEEPTKPAFMQPPAISETDFKRNFKTIKTTPDAMDILLTSGNHDLKTARIVAAEPEAWIYALASFQTMSGYILKHQGIGRMNSGFGSRPCVELLYDRNLGDRWKRDIIKLLNLRASLLRQRWPYKPDGIVLTWLPAWDRRTSLALAQLDPFFIEVSRGVRLTFQDGIIVARTGTEKAPRIDAKAQNGVLGDPWTPINLQDSKKKISSLTVSSSGFTPSLLRDLLFEEGYQLMDMQRPDIDREGAPCQFIASVLVRGEGKTDGFHTADIPVPSTVSRRLFRPGPDRGRLASRSKTAVNDAGLMLNSVLKPAILSLLEAGPKQVNFDRREVSTWWEQAQRRFSTAWHADFFPWLWRTSEHSDSDAARLEWLQALREKAFAVFNNSMDRYPGRAGWRYRARVRANGTFMGSLYKNFPQLKEGKSDNTTNSNQAIEE